MSSREMQCGRKTTLVYVCCPHIGWSVVGVSWDSAASAVTKTEQMALDRSRWGVKEFMQQCHTYYRSPPAERRPLECLQKLSFGFQCWRLKQKWCRLAKIESCISWSGTQELHKWTNQNMSIQFNLPGSTSYQPRRIAGLRSDRKAHKWSSDDHRVNSYQSGSPPCSPLQTTRDLKRVGMAVFAGSPSAKKTSAFSDL